MNEWMDFLRCLSIFLHAVSLNHSSFFFFGIGAAGAMEQHHKDSSNCKTARGTLAGYRSHLYTKEDCKI
jgi:hypothetical protein